MVGGVSFSCGALDPFPSAVATGSVGQSTHSLRCGGDPHRPHRRHRLGQVDGVGAAGRARGPGDRRRRHHPGGAAARAPRSSARSWSASATGVVAEDGTLDRAALAAIVFNDPDELKALTGIVHPAVGVEIAEAHRRRRPRPTTWSCSTCRSWWSRVGTTWPPWSWSTSTPRWPCARLVEHRGFTEEDARARISRQVSREDRLAKADRVLDNSGTVEDLAGPGRRRSGPGCRPRAPPARPTTEAAGRHVHPGPCLFQRRPSGPRWLSHPVGTLPGWLVTTASRWCRTSSRPATSPPPSPG